MALTLSILCDNNTLIDRYYYGEPGVSYYFNNHSSVINVYKDRPTSFSLNVGVRYTVK